ncbi:MAG: BatA domain-containing protein [Gammaproteobacteria bacterium]|nr:BatA domain-containing protein [Gammaproteobacteria bacterium]
MVLLSPVFLFGLIAALIPIGIHLIRKEKPPKVMFSTIRFLKKTSKKLVLFQQIQQWLLLLLRASLIALLVFAFARPLINQSMARLLDADPASVVLLLDNSLSMHYGERFINAREAAIDILNDLDPGDEVALVLFSNAVESVQELTTDIDSVRVSVENLAQPGFGGTSFMPNLRLADQLLSTSRFDNRAVYLISDFQDIALDETDADWKLAPGVAFRGIDVADEESSNLVLTEVRSPQQLLEGDEEQTILARVRSTGSVHISEAEVTLTIDGALVDRQRVDLSETSEAVVNLSANFDGSGAHRGQVTVNGDNFRVDNDFYFTVDVNPKIRVLLVNGEASDNWYDDEGHWFSLAVSSTDVSPFELDAIEPSQLVSGLLRQHDVAVLLNVGDLSSSQAAALNEYVINGGSLLIAPGDRVDPQQFNQQLGDILPATLEGSTEPFLDDYQVIADYDRRHPILRPLTSQWTARFQRHWRMIPAEDADVLMQFDNTLPALVEREIGDGKVILFASTMDLEWNNLALQGMFLPFVHETLRHLVQQDTKQRAYDIGDIIELADAEGDDQFEIRAADGGVSSLSLNSESLRADSPGFVEAISSNSTQVFAVNILPEESNLLKTSPAAISDLIINPETSPIQSREVRTAQMVAELEQPQRVWWWILCLVMILLLVEAKIANKTYR